MNNRTCYVKNSRGHIIFAGNYYTCRDYIHDLTDPEGYYLERL